MTWGEINPILTQNSDFWPGIRIGKKLETRKLTLFRLWQNFARIKSKTCLKMSRKWSKFWNVSKFKMAQFRNQNRYSTRIRIDFILNWSLKAKFDWNIRNSDPDRYHMNQDWYRHVLTKIRYPRDLLIIKTHYFEILYPRIWM